MVSPGLLSLVLVTEHTLHCRRDRVHLFEWHVDGKPEVPIDMREIVGFGWFSKEDALQLSLLPHLRTYFTSGRC